tara:strand:- start:83 stop:259 length:177 start_codon:yes stop_codon:yes gene_type:complete
MEAYNLPIKLREWFVKRLAKQKEDEVEAVKEATKGKSSRSSTLGPGSAPPAMPSPRSK